ncbi:endonuclease/exonuclease/phosphatase family protein [Piscirickettsia litoralis]|uniref:Inositol polyphosphate-related phosphatase domain-containing protein n=1 Tax=Piscirickettsia litoralis TaxID=1891921 RepID=A0ABX3A3P3_9GAMM|nr:hypothetical protein [Piscirickettsia litoralis]ODN43453.1 hypothetical protein BGC07_11650 [Piscirickettsia litoralis]
MPNYRIAALTWNMGNNQIDGSSIDELAAKVNEGEIPDILIVSAQEAKTTALKRERLSERLAKRLTADDGEFFQQLHEDHISVLTKPKGVKNYLKPSETHLGILVSPKIAGKVSIDVITPPGSVRGTNPNKGGVYAVLRIQGDGDKVRRVGVIACHLDSNSQEERAKEVAKLMNHMGGEELDSVIFAGDHNERLELGSVQDGSVDAGLCKLIEAEGGEEELVARFDPLYNNRVAHFESRGFFAPKLSEFTHHEVRSNGKTRHKKERGGVPDAGALDNVLLCAPEGVIDTVETPQVIAVKGPKGQDASDHKAVLVKFQFDTEDPGMDAHRDGHYLSYLSEKHQVGEGASEMVMSTLAAADRYICHRESSSAGRRYKFMGSDGINATEDLIDWLKKNQRADDKTVKIEVMNYLYSRGEYKRKKYRKSSHHQHSRFPFFKRILEQGVSPDRRSENVFHSNFIRMTADQRKSELERARVIDPMAS